VVVVVTALVAWPPEEPRAAGLSVRRIERSIFNENSGEHAERSLVDPESRHFQANRALSTHSASGNCRKAATFTRRLREVKIAPGETVDVSWRSARRINSSARCRSRWMMRFVNVNLLRLQTPSKPSGRSYPSKTRRDMTLRQK
jgi:hypothetical protein